MRTAILYLKLTWALQYLSQKCRLENSACCLFINLGWFHVLVEVKGSKHFIPSLFLTSAFTEEKKWQHNRETQVLRRTWTWHNQQFQNASEYALKKCQEQGKTDELNVNVLTCECYSTDMFTRVFRDRSVMAKEVFEKENKTSMKFCNVPAEIQGWCQGA